MKKWKKVMPAVLMAGMLAGCGVADKDDSVYRVSMVAGTGGVNDQSFNQVSWEGLQSFGAHTGADVRVLESKQASDYLTNIDRATDTYSDLVWALGYSQADAMLTIAKMNPDINFAIVDYAFDESPQNCTGVVFRAQESSFLVGYIAGLTTKTDKVGYVGPMKSFLNDQFQYGYMGGVAYAGHVLGRQIEVQSQFTESYTDAAKAKAISNKMYSNGCDIIFHSAGGAGYGVIESAKENGKLVIGVDTDQSYLAPDNVLTSGMKNTNIAVELVSTMAMEGEKIGGNTYSYGLKEGCVGIPEENKIMDPAVYEQAMALQQMIIDEELTPPVSEETYQSFVEGLGK